jgi:hypothetical protein
VPTKESRSSIAFAREVGRHLDHGGTAPTQPNKEAQLHQFRFDLVLCRQLFQGFLDSQQIGIQWNALVHAAALEAIAPPGSIHEIRAIASAAALKKWRRFAQE